MLKATPDLAIQEGRRHMAEKDLAFGEGTIHRFLVRDHAQKRPPTPSEQERPDVVTGGVQKVKIAEKGHFVHNRDAS
jgi:hypothetical protein